VSGPDWLAALFLFANTGTQFSLIPAALFVSLLMAWIMISPIFAILLSATDEQSCLMPTSGQSYVRVGLGLEAIKLVGLGSLIGLLLLAIILPLAIPFLATAHRALAPHTGWILWSAVIFLALSERPRSAPTALSAWNHITYTLAPVLASLSTLLLSGLLGLILYHRSPIPLTASILNFVPAILGLFAVPGLLMHVFAPHCPRGSDEPRPPSELSFPSGMFFMEGEPRVSRATNGNANRGRQFFHATACGALSGMITALIPALTGSIGALLTQHLVGARNARTHLVAQGVTRMMYYGGGLFLIFLPGAPRMRSSSAALLRTFYEPTSPQVWLMIAVITLSAVMAWLILPVCAKGVLRMIESRGTRSPALIALSGILIFVVGTTSWPGLLILLTATGIGMLPVLFQARPIQGIGVVLIPLAFALTK
jgi:TctA family transporter